MISTSIEGNLKSIIVALFIVILLFPSVYSGFYLPGSYLHTYPIGGELIVKVNSLTSIETELPFSYYSLPYCQPPNGPEKSADNLGELLMGDQIESSPYIFCMNLYEYFYLFTTKPLNEQQVKVLKQRIDDLYQVNLILDNLPVMRYTQHNGMVIKWTGFPMGGYGPDKNHYMINHLNFKVLVHEYEDVRFSLVGAADEGMGVVAAEENAKKKYGFEVV